MFAKLDRLDAAGVHELCPLLREDALHGIADRNGIRLDPHALLFVMQKVEQKFGRTRTKERRWGPRTLDLDLIAYDDVALQKADLTLPHPRLFERAFVLVPLAEIAPDRMIGGIRVRDALASVSTQGIERLPDTG